MKTEYYEIKGFISDYKNNGQASEQEYRLFKTGERYKADNVAHDKGCDLFNYSIKSARATVCRGRDLLGYLATDKATEFVYLTKTKIAYIMSKEEYIEFVTAFGTVTKESAKNGGYEKIRLGHETMTMLMWLAAKAL